MGAHTLHQYISGLAAGLTVLAVGCTTGWTTIAMKKLQASGSIIPIQPYQASWIASLHEAGHIVSPIPTGYIVGRVGPKRCLIASTVIQSVGWCLIIFTRSVKILYIVRFMFGMSMGIVFTVAPLYIAEISNPEVRGALSTGFESMLYLGHLIEFSIGPYVSYNVLAVISITIPMGFLALSVFMVESPYYLVKKKRLLEARRIYCSLTGIEDEQTVVNHLASMEEHLNDNNRGSLRELFTSSVYRQSLIVVLVLATIQRFSGMSAVVAYASLIFPSTIGGLSSSSYTILFGIITLLFTFVSAALMDRSGRRVLTIVSCLGSFVVQFITSLYFYLTQSSLLSPTDISWLPFVTISMYAAFYSIGLGPIVTTIQGELFSPSVKGVAGSIVTIVHAAMSMLVTKLYLVISSEYGVFTCFTFFSINCLVGFIFAYIYMPETKGKTLIEIQTG